MSSIPILPSLVQDILYPYNQLSMTPKSMSMSCMTDSLKSLGYGIVKLICSSINNTSLHCLDMRSCTVQKRRDRKVERGRDLNLSCHAIDTVTSVLLLIELSTSDRP